MFIGVETDERGKALDEVAFKSIGTLASAVLREAELRAARQGTAANWNEAGSGEATASMQPTTGGIGMGGGTPVREDADVPPRRSAGGGQARANVNGKGRGTVKATAVQSHRGETKREEVDARRSTDTALVLVWVNEGMRGASRRQNRAYPSPASRSPLVIVAGRHLT